MTGRDRPRRDAHGRGFPDRQWKTAARRARDSGAGTLWSRLSALDFLGNSFQLAALSLLCFFPFLIVLAAAVGRDAATTLAGWLGLSRQAAQAVASLFPEEEPPGSLTVAGVAMLLLGAVAVAGILQSWYQRLFDVPSRGWRDLPSQLCWLALLLAYGAAQALAGGSLDAPASRGLFGLATATCFWWATMYVFLVPAVSWRSLLPSAVVTAVCWTGLGLFSARYFSAAIVANSEKYGPIGVVMIIMSWLVAVGVVIHLGVVVGRMYQERRSAARR